MHEVTVTDANGCETSEDVLLDAPERDDWTMGLFLYVIELEKQIKKLELQVKKLAEK